MLSPELRNLLHLTLVPGLGPVSIASLIDRFGSPSRILTCSADELRLIKGIGDRRAQDIVRGIKECAPLVDQELELAARLGITIIGKGQDSYPSLLAQIRDAPPILYVKGSFQAADAFPVGIVGSRNATAYGIEQAERFGGVLAAAGLTIVSGGARGVDTAAHRGAIKSGGRTIAVLGCGLAHCYPPENEKFFAEIAAGRGAIVSELPLNSPPEAENFPARNRLISGLSLGIVVIEAGKKSGSLITARLAAEDHGREVMAVPGRVDSAASWGTHELLKQGGASLVTEPGDVLHILETPARHSFNGTHSSRYSAPGLFEAKPPEPATALTARQQSIIGSLDSPATLDELAAATNIPMHELRAEITMLEIQKRISRQGTRFAKSRASH